MFGLPLAFAAPMVLTALALLPALYLLLRITPPRPRQVGQHGVAGGSQDLRGRVEAGAEVRLRCACVAAHGPAVPNAASPAVPPPPSPTRDILTHNTRQRAGPVAWSGEQGLREGVGGRGGWRAQGRGRDALVIPHASRLLTCGHAASTRHRPNDPREPA